MQRWILAAWLLVGWLHVTPAWATSCAPPELATSIEQADVVFVGLAGSKTPGPGGTFVVELTVERVHRGKVPSRVRVEGGGLPGASFETGTKYLVFASLRQSSGASDPPLSAHLCGGTRSVAEAAGWLSELSGGAPPSPPGSAITSGKDARAADDAPDAETLPAPPATEEPSAPLPEPTAEASPKFPPPAPAPPAETKGGCAGCAASGARSFGLSEALAFLALGLVARRRRQVDGFARAAARVRSPDERRTS